MHTQFSVTQAVLKVVVGSMYQRLVCRFLLFFSFLFFVFQHNINSNEMKSSKEKCVGGLLDVMPKVIAKGACVQTTAAILCTFGCLCLCLSIEIRAKKKKSKGKERKNNHFECRRQQSKLIFRSRPILIFEN